METLLLRRMGDMASPRIASSRTAIWERPSWLFPIWVGSTLMKRLKPELVAPVL
jgi:hypothetical protein